MGFRQSEYQRSLILEAGRQRWGTATSAGPTTDESDWSSSSSHCMMGECWQRYKMDVRIFNELEEKKKKSASLPKNIFLVVLI